MLAILKFVFKAVWTTIKLIGSVIAWAGAHVVAATVIAAAVGGVGLWADSQALLGISAVLFGSAMGGYMGGKMGAWFGANVSAHLTGSKVLQTVVGAASLASPLTWLFGKSDRGPLPKLPFPSPIGTLWF